MYTFSYRLAELMGQMTQQEVARATNISQQSISRYLSGQNTPDLEKLVRLCRFFGVSADYMLGLENDDGSKSY